MQLLLSITSKIPIFNNKMKIIMKTFYKSKTPEDSLLVLTRQNYSATAYTETCFCRDLYVRI